MTLNRIVLHHTGGPHKPTALDKKHYHFIIAGDGTVIAGDLPPEANAAGKPLVSGKYAAHTRGLNTGAIGVAVAAMVGAEWKTPEITKAPVTTSQLRQLVILAADLARKYGIWNRHDRILSHAEVEPTLGVKQAGKWDYDYTLPGLTNVGRRPRAIGDQLRALIGERLAGAPVPAPVVERPMVSQGSRGSAVVELQHRLGLAADGIFGPKTRSAVIAFQRKRQLRPDGIVGPMTWAALFPKG